MYYLVAYDGEIELQQDKLEEWQEHYYTIYTNELKAYRHAYSLVYGRAKEQDASISKLVASKNRQIVELLWKYEPDSLNKLPVWWGKLVSDITEGMITL